MGGGRRRKKKKREVKLEKGQESKNRNLASSFPLSVPHWCGEMWRGGIDREKPQNRPWVTETPAYSHRAPADNKQWKQSTDEQHVPHVLLIRYWVVLFCENVLFSNKSRGLECSQQELSLKSKSIATHVDTLAQWSWQSRTVWCVFWTPDNEFVSTICVHRGGHTTADQRITILESCSTINV